MEGLKQSSKLAGLDNLVRETANFEKIVKAVSKIVAEKVYGFGSVHGLAVYL